MGLNILDVFEDAAARDAAGLTPKEGDCVVTAGILEIWDGAQWVQVNNLGGPEGPPWTPGNPIFTITNPAGGTEDMGYKENLKFESETLDISVDTGPTVKIEIPAQHSGAIIPFASGGKEKS